MPFLFRFFQWVHQLSESPVAYSQWFVVAFCSGCTPDRFVCLGHCLARGTLRPPFLQIDDEDRKQKTSDLFVVNCGSVFALFVASLGLAIIAWRVHSRLPLSFPRRCPRVDPARATPSLSPLPRRALNCSDTSRRAPYYKYKC